MGKSGVLYVMTSSIKGLVKIGGTGDFKKRRYILENNGYANVNSLKMFFAIKVKNYEEKEAILGKILDKFKVGKKEIYAINEKHIKELLNCFEGEVVFQKNKREDKLSKISSMNKHLNFYEIGLKNGCIISFIKEPSLKAKIISENKVEYEGLTYSLSKLTYLFYEKINKLSNTGQYAGYDHFVFNGTKLRDLQKTKHK